jgi:hypothetical protein
MVHKKLYSIYFRDIGIKENQPNSVMVLLQKNAAIEKPKTTKEIDLCQTDETEREETENIVPELLSTTLEIRDFLKSKPNRRRVEYR